MRNKHRFLTKVALTAITMFITFGAYADDTVTKKEVYDNFLKSGGYTLSDYLSKWTNIYGLGEMSLGDTRSFSSKGMSIEAVPFKTAADFSVYDHIKYFAASNKTFVIPDNGSLTFSADIVSEVPGVVPNYVISGNYTQSGAPYSAVLLNGQQAAATIHMIDFSSGQLFDWFVSGNRAFMLTERLPSNVTGSPIPVGINKMYTQIIKEVKVGPGKHNYAIQYNRNSHGDNVNFLVDGNVVANIKKIGIPLDVQKNQLITYPSLGAGENLNGVVNNVTFAHGLFSLVDAFPFQHPDAPDKAVSIPISQRIFGQGVKARFNNFVVTTVSKDKKSEK